MTSALIDCSPYYAAGAVILPGEARKAARDLAAAVARKDFDGPTAETLLLMLTRIPEGDARVEVDRLLDAADRLWYHADRMPDLGEPAGEVDKALTDLDAAAENLFPAVSR